MAKGVNKVILIGNLGGDPDVRYMPNGNAIANIYLATNESWRDRQTGESQERTEWHRIVFFNRLAEIVGEFLKKGSKCYVEGSLRTRKWQDKSGIEKYTTEIIASEMHLLDSRGYTGNMSNDIEKPNPKAFSSPTSSNEINEPSPSETTPNKEQPEENTIENDEDDIPF